MAASYLLLCLILFVCLHPASPLTPVIYTGYYMCQAGSSVTATCAPHGTYDSRQWLWIGNLLRSAHFSFHQDASGVDSSRARADMAVNPVNFSLTIGSLQVTDTGRLWCSVQPQGNMMTGFIKLIVYTRWVDVKQDTSLTLECPVVDPAVPTMSRQWYSSPESWNVLFTQNASGTTRGNAARSDMSVDSSTFALTISRVQATDNIMTCRVTTTQSTETGVIFIAVYRQEYEVEENTQVTLPCDKVVELTRQSPVHYTRTWQRVNGDLLFIQYLYNGVFYERSHAARTDMALNNATFALTIGQVQLEDSTMFVCTFYAEAVANHVESVKVSIHNQNRLTLPQVITTMANDVELTSVHKGVESTTENGLESTTVDNGVSPPVTVGLSLPVIGGAVAAAAVLIIVMVVITACLCVNRKKTRVNTDTGNVRRTRESRQTADMSMHDMTSHYEPHLPGGDYHVYERMAADDDVYIGTSIAEPSAKLPSGYGGHGRR